MKSLPVLFLLLSVNVQAATAEVCLEIVRGSWMYYNVMGVMPPGHERRMERNDCAGEPYDRLSY